MREFPYSRVMVVGCPGSGKSTFSRALRDATGLPLYPLDMMYWTPERATVPREVFRAKLCELIEQDTWIIDGNYGSTIEWRLARCNLAFFLDYPLEVCLDGIRSRFGKPREDMPWVEIEENAEFVEYIKRFEAESKPHILRLFERYSDKRVITFRARAEAEVYLGGLRHE